MNLTFWNALSSAVFDNNVPAPHIHHEGALHSPLPVSELLAETTALAGTALARLREQPVQEVNVDARLCAFWSDTTIAPIGWTPASLWDALSDSYRGKDGWIRLHTNATHHKAAALRVLGTADDKSAVTTEVSRWNTQELEQSILGAGGAAAQMLSTQSWMAHPQGCAVAKEPIVHWHTRHVSAPDRLRSAQYNSERPLTGLRVLDLTRVLAGPVATRTLAGFGAEVLRIDPPGWKDTGVLHDTTVGKRCAELNLRAGPDRQQFEALLAHSDLLIHGYRPGALAALGFDDESRAHINPTLIEISLCAYGWTGPWSGRRGFDSLVQFSSGIAELCRGERQEPGKLPVQALDHATGYLMAACAIEALRRARVSGQIASARTSLARLSALLQGCQLPDSLTRQSTAALRPVQDADYAEPIESSDWGDLKRLRPSFSVPGAPMHWTLPSGELRRHAAQWQ